MGLLWTVLAWNYRRYVLASMPLPRPDTYELAYTSKKIQVNFSNFSAWHQRSKVLPKLWASGALDETKSREEGMPPALSRRLSERLMCPTVTEFDLVRNAMYTDPEDQSVWVYHRWLVGSSERPCADYDPRHILTSYQVLLRVYSNGKYRLLKNSLGNNLTANVSQFDMWGTDGIVTFEIRVHGIHCPLFYDAPQGSRRRSGL